MGINTSCLNGLKGIFMTENMDGGSSRERSASSPGRGGVVRLAIVGIVLVGLTAAWMYWQSRHDAGLLEAAYSQPARVERQAQSGDGQASLLLAEATSERDPVKMRKAFVRIIDTYGNDSDDAAVYSVAVSRVNLALLTEDRAEKLDLVGKVIARHRDSADKNSRLAYHVIRAMNLKASLSEGADGRKRLADEAISTYRDSEYPDTQVEVLRAYMSKAGETEDIAEKRRLLDVALKLYEDNNIGEMQSIRASLLGQKAKACDDLGEQAAVFGELAAAYGDSAIGTVQRQVAWAMWKGSDLATDPAERLEKKKEIIAKFKNSSDEYCRDVVESAASEAVALLWGMPGGMERSMDFAASLRDGVAGRKGVALAVWEKMDEVVEGPDRIRLCDWIAKEFGDEKDRKIRMVVLGAMEYKADRSDDPIEKIALYDAIIAAGYTEFSDGLRFFNAVMDRAELAEKKREKIAIYDNALKAGIDNTSDVLQMSINGILNKKAKLLNDPGVKLKYYETVVRDAKQDAAVASALMAMASLISDKTKERDLHMEVIRRFKDSGDSRALPFVANAYKGLLKNSADPAEKERIYDEMISVFLNDSKGWDDSIRGHGVAAMLAKADMTKSKEEKIEWYGRIIDGFENSDDSQIVSSLRSAADGMVRATGNVDAWLRYYGRLVPDEENGQGMARVLAHKVEGVADRAQKIRMYDLIVDKFLSYPDKYVQNVVMDAWLDKARAVGDKAEAATIYRGLIERNVANPQWFSYSSVNAAFDHLIRDAANRDEKIRLHDERLDLYEKRPRQFYWWARAILAKAGDLGEVEDRIRLYDQVIEAGETASDVDESQVISTILVKAGEIADPAAKVKLFDQVIDNYGSDSKHAEYVREAIMRKADALDDATIIDSSYERLSGQASKPAEASRFLKEKERALQWFEGRKETRYGR